MKKFWFSYLQSALVALITIDGKMRSHVVRRARENISTATTQFHSLSVEWSMLDRRPSFASIYRQLWLIQPGRKNFRLSIMAKYSLIGWIKPKCHSIGGVAMFFFVPRRRRAYYYYLICLPSPVVSFIRRHIFLSVPFPVKCITCPLVLSAHVRADDVAIVSYSAPDKWIISLLTFWSPASLNDSSRR